MTQIALAAGRTPDQIVALLKEQGLLQPRMERGYKFRMTSRITGRPRAFRVSRDLLRFAPDDTPENLLRRRPENEAPA